MKNLEERLLDEYFGIDTDLRRQAEARLAAKEPLAYILGDTVFFAEKYSVSPAVLIPRPDTERVVEWALKLLPEGGRFLDLCCGSGCIAISTLCHSRNTEAVLLDISEEALEVAKKNALQNGVYDRCTFLLADVKKDGLPEERFDLIVSNPPYVVSSIVDTLEEECRYEPRLAFDGGLDGGDFYRLFLEICPRHLKEWGKMVFEIGYDQRALLSKLCERHGFSFEIYKDYGKNDRVAVITPGPIQVLERNEST